MSPLRPLLVALGLLQAACVAPMRTARDNPLPPPAQGRAGTRDPGAGPAPGSAPLRARPPTREAAIRRVVETASNLVGAREITVGGVRYGDDCGALVRAAYAEAGSPLPAGDAPALLEVARARGALRRSRPAAGDLAFLAERPGGSAEHVGLIESVSEDGVARVLHLTERGVARLRVDVGRAWKVRSDAGRAVNDVLVVGGGKLPAGRLVVGFATLLCAAAPRRSPPRRTIHRSNTTWPATRARVTVRCGSLSGATASTSSAKAVRSASYPSRIIPCRPSAKAARAGPTVNARSAASREMVCSGWNGAPLAIRRVSAAWSPARGSGSSIGKSEPKASVAPAAATLRQA